MGMGRLTNAERNLNSMQAAKKNEFESMRMELVEAKEEVAQSKQKLSALTARRDTLEKQVKEIKVVFQSKI